MNENIDLTKILKDCPKGWVLYSCIHGEVYFDCLQSCDYPVLTRLSDGLYVSFSREGKYFNNPNSKCRLFPSSEQRDWSKFTAPWYKKKKFDPKTLKPFDKVIGRDLVSSKWECNLFSHIDESAHYSYRCIGNYYKICIPFNDDTKHLVETIDEAPEYYKYWED